VYFSVIVVGTFLEHVDELAHEYRLPLQYFEVSCSASLENIDQVQEAIFKTALSHSYMGERVPKSYLTVAEYLKKEAEEKKAKDALPIIDLPEVFQKYSEPLVKRALGLLSLWGECVYFESPPRTGLTGDLGSSLPGQRHPC